MQSNSCLYRALKKVVAYQFGIHDLVSDVFDANNDGRGIVVGRLPTVIDDALRPHGICIDAIYANVIGDIDKPHLLRSPGLVPAPNITMVDNGHAEACLPGDTVGGVMAIVLRKV